MKKIIIIGILFISSFCDAQISDDYPFKTFLDSENCLYTTGYEYNLGTRDIIIKKISHSTNLGDSWTFLFTNNAGDDRGLDMVVDRNGRTFVTGYLYNSETNSNDIIVISLHSDGTFHWSDTLRNYGDDKGLGIEISKSQNGNADEVYVCGYISTQNNYKDFIIKKYNATNGDSLWQTTFGKKFSDDIATDILIDDNYAYVLGYSYFGSQRMNDIALLTFDLDYGTLQEALYDERAGTDDKPTGFVIAEKSQVPITKSRIALTSNTDFPNGVGTGRKFLTMYLEPSTNNEFRIRWSREYLNCPTCRNEAITSISQDYTGDIYSAGYILNINQRNRGLDFLTMKYTGDSGSYAWPGNIRLYNYEGSSSNGFNDRASSIKINNQKDVYVAGVSDASPSGYSYVKYTQNSGQPVLEFDRIFIPGFLESNTEQGQPLKKWSTMHLANDGTPLMVVMGWNETEAHWAAIRYDADGNVLYTINNESGDFINRTALENKLSAEVTLTNYPNPFNPVTNLEFGISKLGFVTLKIYDMLGKLVKTLVNENLNAGIHSIEFDGSNLSSGVYYYALSINGITKQRRSMILMK